MAQLVGVFRIGRDAEVRYTPGGDPVASLSLAYNHGKENTVQWIDASLWGKRAEAMAPYLKKGGMIYAVIDGPHIETYQGKNGEGHKLAGRAIEIEFAGGKGGAESGDKPAPRQAQPKPAQHGGSGFDDMEDDIPF